MIFLALGEIVRAHLRLARKASKITSFSTEVYCMKNKTNLPGILGIVALVATLCAFLFPLGPAALTVEKDVIYGYDLMFGNKAIMLVELPIGAYIAVFVLLVISSVFQLLATVFGFHGGKFTGFLHILSGLMLGASAVLVFLVSSLFPASDTAVTLAWGFIATGASLAVSALLSLFIGVSAFGKKSK